MLSLTMFRDAVSKLSLRKKLTMLALVGVFLPVLVLTYMQYRSLSELRDKTKGAIKDNLRQGLPFVERQMQQRLEEIGTQTLDPIGTINPSSHSSPRAAEELEKHFANVRRSHPEIEEVFAFYADEGTNSYGYVYSDRFVKISEAEFSPRQSHILALFEKSQSAQNFLDRGKYSFAHESVRNVRGHASRNTFIFSLPLSDKRKTQRVCGCLIKPGFCE
jgi:hypothetical protein